MERRHLYQAILNGEDHVSQVDYLTTLAGYIHWQLTGEKILGIGDASGMFPIDITTGDYDASMVTIFNRLAAEAGVPLDLAAVLPTVQSAGTRAGELTAAGARLLDPTGRLQSGVPCAHPKATPVPAWSPPTPSPPAPATSAPAPASSPWSCSSTS